MAGVSGGREEVGLGEGGFGMDGAEFDADQFTWTFHNEQ
jgi:hypothetical protein